MLLWILMSSTQSLCEDLCSPVMTFGYVTMTFGRVTLTTFGCVTMTFGCHHDNVDVSPWQHLDVSTMTTCGCVTMTTCGCVTMTTFGCVTMTTCGCVTIHSWIHFWVDIHFSRGPIDGEHAARMTSLHDVLHSVSSLKLHRKDKNCTRFPSALEFVLAPVTWLVGSMYYSINFPQSLNQAHTQER